MPFEQEELEPLLAKGWSRNQISKHYGCSQCKVDYWCDKYGLKSDWQQRNEQRATLLTQGLKQCATCSVIKPLEDFDKDPRSSDGRSSQCKEDRKVAIAQWQVENYEKVKASSRDWKARNPDRVRAYSAKYWAENKEACKTRRAEWMTPERNSYYLRLRRDRKAGARGICSFEQLRWRWEVYGGLCWICGKEADTIDHVIPLARGGTEWPANLRPACRSCNSSKGASWKDGMISGEPS